MIIWTCRDCVEREAGCNLPADVGAWAEPSDPDVTCSQCGEYPAEAVRLRLIVERMRMLAKPLLPEQLVRAQAEAPRNGPGVPTPTSPPCPGRAAIPVPDQGLWNAHQAAAFLGVSRSAVFHWAAAGTIPCVRVGHSLRFDPDALRAWARGERGGGRVVAMKK